MHPMLILLIGWIFVIAINISGVYFPMNGYTFIPFGLFVLSLGIGLGRDFGK